MDLEQQFDEILAAAEPAQVEKPEEAEVKQELEAEGVDEAAETSNNDESEEQEGQEPSDEFEEELKNIDPEVREALSKVDAEVKRAQLNAFKKMRASFDRKQTEFGQEKKLAETTKQFFARHGIDTERGYSQLETLIEFEKELKKDPAKIINVLKAKFNVQDKKSGSDELDETLLTDEERLIYQEQKNIKKTVETLIEENRRLKEDREREEINRATAEIIKFKEAKTSDGSLANPYFDDLLPDIQKLTAIYPNDSIDKLYNRALRLNDEIYSKSIESAKEAERKRLSAEKEAALKKAKSINSQSIKPTSKPNQERSLDDILLSILENASN